MKRYRVTFPDLNVKYEVEAPSRPRALVAGLAKLNEAGLRPVEINTTEQRPGWSKESAEGSGYTQTDVRCQVYCLDEPPPSSKYDEKGHLRKVPNGKRHPAPVRAASGGVPAPSLPPGRGIIKGRT